ncbi:hypothetical protein BDN70DRAFT_820552, partial [Pholiota conissans]
MLASKPEASDQQIQAEEKGEEVTGSDELPFPEFDHWTYPVGYKPASLETAEDWDSRSHLLVSLNKELVAKFAAGYKVDSFFKSKYVDEIANPQTVVTPSHFRKDPNGLLFFLDADWKARLCVPQPQVNFVLKWIHDSPFESAHAGAR